jgi:hypothetical protein
MQRTLIQGDSLNFRTTPRDYTADQGWALTYLLVPRAGGERLQVETVADGASFLVQASALDVRTQSEVALDAINAVLANRATMDQQNYAIGGRSLSRMQVADLLALRQHYVREIKRERGLQSRYVLGYR